MGAMWSIESIKDELENLFQQEKYLWIPSAFVESCIVGRLVERMNKIGVAKIKIWLNNQKTKELKLKAVTLDTTNSAASSAVIEEQ